MGLLDDAIRDHLELKRRRGADPAEVERAEQEALGPVRRQPEGDDDLDFGDAPAAGEEQASAPDDLPYDDELPGYTDEPSAQLKEPSAYRDEPPAYADEPGGYEREPVASEDEVRPQGGWSDPAPASPLDSESPGVDTKPHETVRDPAESPPAESPSSPASAAREPTDLLPPRDPATPPPHPAGRVGEETAEYDVEAEHAAGDQREDVLEETPEFLQDTPDHDRLWFEQRPPRDFDFDG
jgi:hypothetical protein